MPRDDAGDAPPERTAHNRWEVARPRGGTSPDGVRMAGYRDRTGSSLDMQVLPQPAVIVVIGLGTGPITVECASGHRPLEGLVASLSPRPARIRGEGVECVEVALSPRAAYTLLGVSPLELDGTITGLDDLWGRHARLLREQLADTTSWQERLALTDGFLRRRATGAPPMAAEVAAAWDAIVARRGRVRVADLAADCGWSRKRLWARFSAQVGLTPKRAAMVVRFDHAARALLAGERAGDVAAACGYADQPHLHRDIQALAGCTPATLAGLSASTEP
ncbi:helix-turn-helix transcriptional regulator [Streptomyces erythrochromogenes]|uniref:helix-turn-helix transcriptional regulator n=1 Tax=Streptomyces erythrochromogenes TaxID=285574 RepID=UPI003867FB96|nr:helix-turn-helix transcriptional regulator [Streptomyces erythrochromogenes]